MQDVPLCFDYSHLLHYSFCQPIQQGPVGTKLFRPHADSIVHDLVGDSLSLLPHRNRGALTALICICWLCLSPVVLMGDISHLWRPTKTLVSVIAAGVQLLAEAGCSFLQHPLPPGLTGSAFNSAPAFINWRLGY